MVYPVGGMKESSHTNCARKFWRFSTFKKERHLLPRRMRSNSPYVLCASVNVCRNFRYLPERTQDGFYFHLSLAFIRIESEIRNQARSSGANVVGKGGLHFSVPRREIK